MSNQELGRFLLMDTWRYACESQQHELNLTRNRPVAELNLTRNRPIADKDTQNANIGLLGLYKLHLILDKVTTLSLNRINATQDEITQSRGSQSTSRQRAAIRSFSVA
jgi:hypothetical protein